jgi:hypothetical protein
LLAPLLLQCSWFSGLVLLMSCLILSSSFHSSSDVTLRVLLFFSLISIFSLSSEILSSACSSLGKSVFFVWLKEIFISRNSVWFFSQIFYIIIQLLFYILCCLL